MTREEAIKWLKTFKDRTGLAELSQAFDIAIKALEVESLTDTEQRIFLAAMSREEEVCKDTCADGEGVDLVAVCKRVKRKVKKVLWD